MFLIAPKFTDKEYARQLVDGMTAKNVEDTAYRLAEFLKTSEKVTRKEIQPFLEKLLHIWESGVYNGSILTVLNENNRGSVQSEDLRGLVEFSLDHPSVQKTDGCYALFALAASVIRESAAEICGDINQLTVFGGDHQMIVFIKRLAELEPSLRVPLVFSGLVEEIIQTRNNTELLPSLVNAPQARQYMIEMNHIIPLTKILFDSMCNDTITDTFISLLDDSDLTNMIKIQDTLMEILPQLLSQEFLCSNSLRIVRAIIHLHPVYKLPISYSELLGMISRYESEVLSLIEEISLSSPHLIPVDGGVTARDSFREDITLKLLYYSYDCNKITRISPIDFKASDNSLALSTEERVLHPESEFLSQSGENNVLQRLAAINILACTIPENPAPLLTLAMGFNSNSVPFSFRSWCRTAFDPSRRLFWLSRQRISSDFTTVEVFSVSPSQAQRELSTIHQTITSLSLENIALKDKCELLTKEQISLNREIGELECHLILSGHT